MRCLHVTPAEFLAVSAAIDEARCTIDGTINAAIWAVELGALLGVDLTAQLSDGQETRVVIEYDGVITERVTRHSL